LQIRVTKQQKNEENSRKEYSLNARRQKLSNLLFEENLAFNQELASMFDWKESNEQDLKKKYEDLIAKKKEDRKVKNVYII
jgi:type II secretory pathway component PulK